MISESFAVKRRAARAENCVDHYGVT